MSAVHRLRLGLGLAAVSAAVAVALPACGGDDDSSDTSTAKSSESASGPSPKEVLSCLRDAGLEAKDQGNSMGDVVGIDYPEGRTVISFSEDEEDAETGEMVQTGEYFREGLIIVSLAESPQALEDRAAIEPCVEG